MMTFLGLIPKWVWAALVAALAATSCKLTIDLGSVKLELEKAKVALAEQSVQIARSNHEASIQTATLTRRVLDAERSARDRQAVIMADASAARAALDGLRKSLATPYGLLGPKAGISTPALAVPADPVPELFFQCAARYSDLATKADGHVSDIKTLTGAWPVNLNSKLESKP